MSDTDGDRRSALAAPPDQEVASRLALLGALALVAGVLLGAFAAIVVIVAGLALLAMAAAARVNRARQSSSRRRARPVRDVERTEPPRAPKSTARRPAQRSHVPRATH